MANITERYANALLDLSNEGNTLEKDLEQAILVRDTLGESEVQAFLLHPHVPNSEKYKLFNNVFAGVLSNNLIGLLHLMVRKNRESLIVPVLTEYIECANKRLGIIEAKVVSANALTQKQIESIHAQLTKKTSKQIKIIATVDPDVIGGFYILIDGHIFDGTIRSKLNTLKESLKRGVFCFNDN